MCVGCQHIEVYVVYHHMDVYVRCQYIEVCAVVSTYRGVCCVYVNVSVKIKRCM